MGVIFKPFDGPTANVRLSTLRATSVAVMEAPGPGEAKNWIWAALPTPAGEELVRLKMGPTTPTPGALMATEVAPLMAPAAVMPPALLLSPPVRDDGPVVAVREEPLTLPLPLKEVPPE